MTQKEEDLHRYKRYVQQGHSEFQPAIDFLEGRRKAEEAMHQVEIRNLIRDKDLPPERASDITGLSLGVIRNLLLCMRNTISKSTGERAIERLSNI